MIRKIVAVSTLAALLASLFFAGDGHAGASLAGRPVRPVGTQTGDSSLDQAISASSRVGCLAVRLGINPADQGRAHITARIAAKGRPVTAATVRVGLAPLDPPGSHVPSLALKGVHGSFNGTAVLSQEGLWRADIRVSRLRGSCSSGTVTFVFVAAADPGFLAAPSTSTQFGAATVRVTGAPGAAAALEVRLRPHLRVRYVVTMPGMNADIEPLSQATSGWYHGVLIPSMEGYMNLEIQAHARGAWQQVRMLVFGVDGNMQIHVLA
jgi:hypothetical protein